MGSVPDRRGDLKVPEVYARIKGRKTYHPSTTRISHQAGILDPLKDLCDVVARRFLQQEAGGNSYCHEQNNVIRANNSVVMQFNCF